MVDKDLIRAAFEIVDGWQRGYINREFDRFEHIPEAVGMILILGDAILPGCISQIAAGVPQSNVDELIRKLKQEDPFANRAVVGWLKEEGAAYPGTAAYLIALDSVRKLAIEFLVAR